MRAIRTASGVLIGSATQPRMPAWKCSAASGPHKRKTTLGDEAVKWACVLGIVTVIGILIAERFA